MGEEGTAFAHALRRETDGNPFFLTELLRHLNESGAVVQDSSGRYGLATLCIGGGMGVATVVERL